MPKAKKREAPAPDPEEQEFDIVRTAAPVHEAYASGFVCEGCGAPTKKEWSHCPFCNTSKMIPSDDAARKPFKYAAPVDTVTVTEGTKAEGE